MEASLPCNEYDAKRPLDEFAKVAACTSFRARPSDVYPMPLLLSYYRPKEGSYTHHTHTHTKHIGNISHAYSARTPTQQDKAP